MIAPVQNEISNPSAFPISQKMHGAGKAMLDLKAYLASQAIRFPDIGVRIVDFVKFTLISDFFSVLVLKYILINSFEVKHAFNCVRRDQYKWQMRKFLA